MKLNATGGTDVASIVLFWPDNLPEDFDAALPDDPMGLVQKLKTEGKIICFPCDSDGEYALGLWMREPIPDQLMAFCQDKEEYPNLIVKGDGYFGGMEYVFKNDASRLEKHPHMCERVIIPRGCYRATVYCTDVPEAVYETWLMEHAGPAAKRPWDIHGGLAALAVVCVIATLTTFFFLSWQVWSWIAAVTAVVVFAAVLLARTQSYRAVAEAQEKYTKAYPAYVVHLE